MPYKGGKLTPQERVFARAYAETQNQEFARMKSGMSHTSGNSSRALQRPGVIAEIERCQKTILRSEGAEVAVRTLINIAKDERQPAGARVQASDKILRHAWGSEDASERKDPSEMSADELRQAIERLHQEAGNRAKTIEGKAIDDRRESPENGAFD